MTLSEQNCSAFVQLLASKEPVPGGGGGAALVGAVGTALGHMVGALTTGKAKYVAVEADIQTLMAQAETLQEELLSLIQKDADVFAPLAKAYGMPKDTQAQREEKARVMERVLKEACQVPMEIMACCGQAIELCAAFAEKGSKLALSDAGAGASLCRGALVAASLNVYINTKAMRDAFYGAACNRKADALITRYTALADQVLSQVMGELN